MKKEHLNKITGFLAIASIFGFVFLISWLFNKTGQKIEGPHIFYSGDTIQSLTINITGNKRDKTYEIINPTDVGPALFKVKIPSGQYISFNKHDKIEIPKHQYPVPQKILAISDVEGDFDFLKEILRGNKIIDDKYNWTFGQGHLVVVGDIFDRGKYVTECLWLLYKLEKEASKAGGQVHIILGNHEVMTLQGDHRYVHRKYKRIVHHLKMDYKDLYGIHTEMGRWLRSKNTVEIIGNTLFVHGGISPELISKDLTVGQLNDMVRENLDSPNKMPKDSDDILVMGKMGPLWYRRYIEDPIKDEEVQKIINHFNIDKIVIGHSLVKEITPLFNHKVYALDVKRTKEKYTALLIEDSNYFTTTAQGVKNKL